MSGPAHAGHLVLTVLTLGLWLAFYTPHAAGRATGNYRCTTCGTELGMAPDDKSPEEKATTPAGVDRTLHRKSFATVDAAVAPEERVVAYVAGNVENRGTVIAVTDQRVLVSQGSELIHEVPLADVREVTADRGRIYSKLGLTLPAGRIEVKQISERENADVVVAAITEAQ